MIFLGKHEKNRPTIRVSRTIKIKLSEKIGHETIADQGRNHEHNKMWKERFFDGNDIRRLKGDSNERRKK